MPDESIAQHAPLWADVSGLELSIEKACALIDRLRAENAELLAALQLYVDHFGDPLKVARTAIAKAQGRS